MIEDKWRKLEKMRLKEERRTEKEWKYQEKLERRREKIR